MTITIGTIAHAAASASGTTQTLAVTAPAGAGLLIFSISGGGQNISPVFSDDKGSVYTQLGGVINNSGDSESNTCFYCKSLAGANPTITQDFTAAGARTLRGILAIPITGHDATATPVRAGQNQSSPGTGTDAVTTTNVTPGAQPGKFIAFACNSFNQSLAAGTGWTDNGGAFASWTSGTSNNTRVESKNYSALTATAATFTQGGAGTGRTVSQIVAWPDGVTYTRPRGYLTLLMAMFAAGVISSAPAPSPGPSPSPPPAPPATYGSTADAGEIDDPTISAPTYSAGALYTRGTIVTNGSGTYYMAWYDSLGVALTDVKNWFQFTWFYYVDATAGSDSNIGSANPATAKAAPLQSMQKIEDYLNTGGSVNAIDGALILGKRGDTHYTNITFLKTAVCGSWGNTSLARPKMIFRNNGTNVFNGNCFQMSVRSWVRNWDIDGGYICHITTTGANTLVDGDTVTRSGTGDYAGTVRGNPVNNRVCIEFTSRGDAYLATHGGNQLAGGNVFQTSGGTRSCTLASGLNFTVVNCVTAQADDCAVDNCSIHDAVGNGLGAGNTGTRNSADYLYVVNCTIWNTCKWTGAGAGGQGGWGSFSKYKYNTTYDNGGNNNLSHNWYLDDMDDCEFAFNWMYMTGAFGNHALVIHGQCARLDIHDNLMEYSQCGFGMNDGYSGAWAESYTDCNFYRNIIRFCGTYNGSGQIFDLKCNINCKYFNNVAYANKGVVAMSAYNSATNSASATNGIYFIYNTLISDTTVGSGDYFFKVMSSSGTACQNVVVRNNILESQRTNLATFYTDASTPAGNVTFEYNLIYNITGYANVMRWVNVVYTLTSWKDATGINSNNTNKTTTNYAGVFTNKVGNDYSIPVSSPAKASGTYYSGVLGDFIGATRSTSTPSIGAYE